MLKFRFLVAAGRVEDAMRWVASSAPHERAAMASFLEDFGHTSEVRTEAEEAETERRGGYLLTLFLDFAFFFCF